jgi:serine/threonine protein kinase/ABC-type transport system substrate-binding protein
VTVAGRYTLIRPIGRGGMAEIWKAKATGPSGFVKFFALKMILPDLSEDRVFVPMFVDEAKLEASLSHPNLIQVFDFGEADDDQLFLAMEYVQGGNVDRLLSRLHKAGEPLPTELAIYIAREVARGLGYAHTKTDANGAPLGIVHRDVSPQNILVSTTGDVKLGDFGIAKAASVIPRTAAGHVRGKLAYMSPEHIGARKLDGRSDLFSLGVVLYEMCTGARLFGGKSGEEISEQVKKFDPMADLDLSRVPDKVSDLLVVLLQQEPADRYADAQQLEVDLGKRLGVAGIAKAQKDLGALVTRMFEKELAADARDERDEPGDSAPVDRNAETVVTPKQRSPIETPRTKKRLAIAAGAAAIVAGAAGVGFWKLAGETHAADTRRGGTLKLAIGFPDERFDAFSIEWSKSRITLTMVIESFMKVGRDGEISPWTIERFELSPDGKTVELRVRDGVMFHAHPCLGKPRAATGKDVAFSIRAAQTAKALVLPIDEIAETPAGVKITLTDPAPFYESQFADVKLLPHELGGCEDLRNMKQPVGTGPFRFVAPPKGARWSLARAPAYWHRSADGAQLPYLEALAIEPVDDLAQALSRVSRGELDILVPHNDDWPNVFDRQNEVVELKERWRGLGVDLVATTSNSRLALFGLLVAEGDHALRDPRVRLALAKALDRAALVAKSERPLAGPTGRFLDPRMLGYDAKLPELALDLAAARDLLAQAGFPNGAGLEPVTVGTMRDQKVGAELVAQAAAIGIPITLVTIPPASISASIEKGDVDAFLGQNIWRLRSGENAELIPENTRFLTTPRLAKLHVDLLATPDRAARAPIYRQMEQLLLEDVPTIPIAWGDARTPYEVYVVQKRVRDFHDPITRYGKLDDLARTWLAPPR